MDAVSSNKNRFYNKYTAYREQYDKARNFDKELHAKETDKSKDTAKSKDSEKPKADASPDQKKPDLTLSKNLASESSSKNQSTASEGASTPPPPVADAAPLAPMSAASSQEINVPNTGSASDRMMDKVKQYEPHIRSAAARYNIDPNWIAGVIWQESRGNPRAVSHCGAMGLMQLMPGTAKQLGVSNAFDIGQNIDGGAKYLRQMLDTFSGNMSFATAAYNAGPGNVMKHRGIPPFRETQDYVPKVLGAANSFKVAQAFPEQTQTTALRV